MLKKSPVCVSGFQSVCVHLHEVPQESECSRQHYLLITSYLKVFLMFRCQMKQEIDHNHLLESLWCLFNEETGNWERNGDNSPFVQCSTPKQQISLWMMLEKDSDVTVLNTLIAFF